MRSETHIPKYSLPPQRSSRVRSPPKLRFSVKSSGRSGESAVTASESDAKAAPAAGGALEIVQRSLTNRNSMPCSNTARMTCTREPSGKRLTNEVNFLNVVQLDTQDHALVIRRFKFRECAKS